MRSIDRDSKLTADDVSAAVAGYWDSCTWSPRGAIIVPNSTGLAGWEADLLIIHPSGWCDEVEIKVSLGDFKREFTASKKCSKHKALVNGVPDTRPGLPYMRRLPTGTYSKHIVRRFWFAIPSALHDSVLPLLPQHAGLIVVGPDMYGRAVHRARKVVQAPQLRMSRKVTQEERDKAIWAVYYRYWMARHTDGRWQDRQKTMPICLWQSRCVFCAEEHPPSAAANHADIRGRVVRTGGPTIATKTWDTPGAQRLLDVEWRVIR